MDNIDRDFCNICDNKLKIGCNNNEKSKYPTLVTICETCNEKKEYELDEITDKQIHYTPYKIDYSKNQYGDIINDNTIPFAENQTCTKCENKKIKYICINMDEMKYVFICTNCKIQWTTINNK